MYDVLVSVYNKEINVEKKICKIKHDRSQFNLESGIWDHKISIQNTNIYILFDKTEEYVLIMLEMK